tara:strand:+ start:133 stop:555 length:423 start_codon:yes stop_codon:yes gene_type:complete
MPRVVSPELPEPLESSFDHFWDVPLSPIRFQTTINDEIPEPIPLTRSVATVVPWDEDEMPNWVPQLARNEMPNWVPQLARNNAEDGTEASWSSDEEDEEDNISEISEDSLEARCLQLETEGQELLAQMNQLYIALGFNQQ